MTETVIYLEPEEMFLGEAQRFEFDFTNGLAVGDTIGAPGITIVPTVASLTSTPGYSGQVGQVLINAVNVAESEANREIVVQAIATGSPSGLKPILRKKITLRRATHT